MAKVFDEELQKNGQGQFVVKLSLNFKELKLLNFLLECELMAQRQYGKNENYQRARNLKTAAQTGLRLVRQALQKDHQTRYEENK